MCICVCWEFCVQGSVYYVSRWATWRIHHDHHGLSAFILQQWLSWWLQHVLLPFVHCASKGSVCSIFKHQYIIVTVKSIMIFWFYLPDANEVAVEMTGGLYVKPVVLLLLVTLINLCLLSSSTLNTDRSLALFEVVWYWYE